MALRLKPGERLNQAITRSARAELRDAADAIVDEDRPLGDRIHEVRTATKKVRALARLVRPEAGRPSRRADRRLRKLARSISAVRDAAVLLHTFDALIAELPGPRGDSLMAARASLAGRLEARARPFHADEKATRRMRKRLRKLRCKVRRWVPPDGRWRIAGPGFAAGYRRARRAMAAAYGSHQEAATEEAFHGWRRAVKSHRYQVQLLSAISPAWFGRRLEDLETLGELLGDEHDLALLAETLRRERTCFAKANDCDRVLARLEERRQALRERARPLGDELFADRPRDFRREARSGFRRYCDASRRRSARAARAA